MVLVLMSAHPFLKNILGTPLLIQPPPPRITPKQPYAAKRSSPVKQSSPPQEEKHVKFAPFVRTHEYYDTVTMQWVNYGWHPTVRMSQFRAGNIDPVCTANEEDD